jgi:phosphotransferase system enzyme I (PtsP)
MIVRTANSAGTPVTLCGEMAGNPLAALALVALGFRSLSMSPAAIGPVKAMVLALDAGRATALVDRLLDGDNDDDNLRTPLADFAEAESIPT